MNQEEKLLNIRIEFRTKYPFMKKVLILFLFFNMIIFKLLHAQIMISRNLNDYPSGTVFPSVFPGKIILPAVNIKATSTYTIPLLVSLPYTVTVVAITGGCDEITNNNTVTNLNNLISVLVSKKSLTSDGNYIDFTLNIIKTSYTPEIQEYRVPVLRDSAKVVLALDISGNMQLNIGGGTGTRIQALKNAVNMFVPKLEEFQQEGDSLGLTYYSSIVYQPSNNYFPKNFVGITSNNEPVLANYASQKVLNDLDPRVPLQMNAMASGLLDAKNKLLLYKDKTPNTRRIVFFFSSGLQDFGNLIKPDGISIDGTTDSLNNRAKQPKDSIIYVTVSTSSAADVPPIMAAIAQQSKGVSLNIDGDLTKFEEFCSIHLANILSSNGRFSEIAARITNLSPLNGAEGVNPDQTLTLDFNEKVNIANGSVYIKRYKDDSLFEQVDITSGKVTGNGTSTLVISPSGSYESLEKYYVLVDAGAVVGKSGNPFAGITSKGYWSFTIKDVTNSIPISKALDNDIKIYSSQGNIVIQFQNFESGRYANVLAEIYSVDGKLIQKKMLNSPINTITTNHAIDVFIVKLILKDAVFSKKIFNQ